MKITKSLLWISALVIISIIVGLLIAKQMKRAPLTLENSTWVARQMRNTPIPPIASPTLILSNSSANGNASCNTYQTSYILEGKKLQFGNTATTKRWCERLGSGQNLMAQELAFLETLKMVRSYHITGSELFMLDENEQVILILEKAPED